MTHCSVERKKEVMHENNSSVQFLGIISISLHFCQKQR